MINRPSVHPSPGAAGHIVVGLLPNVEAAGQTLELRSYGLSNEQIGLVIRQTDHDAMPDQGGAVSPISASTAKGAVGGGMIGGLAGLLTTMGLVLYRVWGCYWLAARSSHCSERPAQR